MKIIAKILVFFIVLTVIYFFSRLVILANMPNDYKIWIFTLFLLFLHYAPYTIKK